MKTIAVASAPTSARERMIAAPQAFLVWLIPAFYQLSLSAMFRSAEFTRANVALGRGLLAVAIACGGGPFAGWLVMECVIESKANAILQFVDIPEGGLSPNLLPIMPFVRS